VEPPIKVRDLLANVPLFRELAPEEIDRVAERTRKVSVPRGEIMFHRGSPALGMYIIVFGSVKLVFNSASGIEKVVDILVEGQSFGEAVMFMESTHVVSAHALADSMLLYIAREAIFEELERDGRFARRMIAGLSRRLHYLVADIEAVSMRSGTQRVIGYLLCEKTDAVPGADSIDIRLQATKGVIASRLNLTQEHFSRILHELVSRSLIEVKGRQIHIPDVERLKNYAP